jgi:hypothetical protein
LAESVVTLEDSLPCLLPAVAVASLVAGTSPGICELPDLPVFLVAGAVSGAIADQRATAVMLARFRGADRHVDHLLSR